MELTKVDLFTDGACSGNPGAGGWGAILRCKGTEKELSREDTAAKLRQHVNDVVRGHRHFCVLMNVHKNRHVSDDIVAVVSDDRERGRMLFVEGIGFFRKVKALPENSGLGLGLVEQMPAPLEKFQWSNCLVSHAGIFAAKIRGLWTRRYRLQALSNSASGS